MLFDFSAGCKFDVCIVDDASLCCEVELLSLFRLQFNTLLLVGDEKLQTTKTENEVTIIQQFIFLIFKYNASSCFH